MDGEVGMGETLSRYSSTWRKSFERRLSLEMAIQIPELNPPPPSDLSQVRIWPIVRSGMDTFYPSFRCLIGAKGAILGSNLAATSYGTGVARRAVNPGSTCSS